jgi:two-component system, NtrC family, nitrogen regulation sensor histidine kinase NtrY
LSSSAQPILQGQAEPKRARVSTWVGFVLVILALTSACVTFLVISGSTRIVPVHRVVISLFVMNALIILALLLVVLWQGFGLVQARRKGAAAAGLHVRLILLFGFVAALPAILVAVIATITLEKGLEPWFSNQMREVIFKSVEVADTYTTSQCTNMGREIRLMAGDITSAREIFDRDRAWFEGFMTVRARALGLPIVFLVKNPFEVVARANITVLPDPAPLASEAFDEASASDDPICTMSSTTRVFSVLMRLREFPDLYLFIARQVDALAVEFPTQARAAAGEYLAIDARRQGVQIAFGSMYVLISLTVLLSAVWFGLSFADRLVAPIRRMIHATDQVASGNFYVQVPVKRAEGDLAHLGETFNKMTAELRRQRDGLIEASEVIDRRRRFTETVLAGVSAGVIGLDNGDMVTLLNRSAEALLGTDRRGIGKPLSVLAPELSDAIRDARQARQRMISTQVVLMRQGRERTLNVRVSREGEGAQLGLVVTLDDITDLVAAQRTSAWADVARRIAHEIKNPLTPIQLSAERIRRKFGKAIVEDRAILDQCTDTIIRQVEDIRRMVDEFASFARMPKPLPASDDLAAMVREVAFLLHVGNPELTIETLGVSEPAMAVFDRRLVSQALGNIIKNAAEAIEGIAPAPGTEHHVNVGLEQTETHWRIDVMDTGKGFPAENRQRLLEPYMTTRDSGTGLGLAIVSKIFEDHGGRIELLDRPDGQRGALVRLWLPKQAVSTHGDIIHRRGQILAGTSSETTGSS